MWKTGVTAAIAALALGAAIVTGAAQSVPVPTPAPKRDSGASTMPASPPQVSAPSGNPFFPFGQSKPAPTFDANQRTLADRVSLYLSSIQTLVGNFVQVGPDGTRTEGQLYIQKPGKVRFEYNPPSPIDVIADGQSVVVRDRKLATQDLYPLSQTPLRFLLSDRIDLLQDTNVIAIKSDDVFVTIVIEEKQQFVGTSRLMLMFGNKDLQLRQWTVTDPQGYDTTVAVYNLDTTKRPDPNLFVINYDANNVQRAQ